MGKGRRRCSKAVWHEGWEGVHRGYFQIPVGMVVRHERRQSICHLSNWLGIDGGFFI